MSAQAARWSQHGTRRRFGARGRPAELAALAANLDELLDRRAAVLRHEQQLSAELSHELRTPLARITAEADWLTGRPRNPAEQQASHEAIAAGAAAMRHICETLLTEARAHAVEGGSPVPGRCAVEDVADALARRSAEEHPKAPPVTVSGTPVTVGVSAPLAERILAPLLDNARRYATHTIRLDYAPGPGGARVSVSDDGPGVAPGLGAAVFAAGRRADPADGHDERRPRPRTGPPARPRGRRRPRAVRHPGSAGRRAVRGVPARGVERRPSRPAPPSGPPASRAGSAPCALGAPDPRRVPPSPTCPYRSVTLTLGTPPGRSLHRGQRPRRSFFYRV